MLEGLEYAHPREKNVNLGENPFDSCQSSDQDQLESDDGDGRVGCGYG